MNRYPSFSPVIGLAIWGIVAVTAPVSAADMMDPTAPAAQNGHLYYLAGGQPDAISLLTPPPLPDSAEQAADMAEVRAVCHAAPSNDVAATFSEKKFSVFNFTPAVGTFFQSQNLPKTTAFFERAQKDAAAVTDVAKDYYKRPRPYVTDPSLAKGKVEKSFSYPSGHSTESMVLALVLADLIPDRQDAIIAGARAIVRQLKQSEAFQKDFAEVKAEIAAARTAGNN